ncbi:glycoside hydrolase family 20 protein [Cavenderia fasciculata]|uniref:beta-N-acetylhexosaminidase n=1 Tax=Cavenderia fasciculata TaxID=261658 RepID=F4PNK3_CACFS|nr:glycoside hydrolase family 20 protein [Cavenderia fasciculata]EGG23056.1 glycoside hydrolase family 20 protein [Cavenderia fasciculata]|eukprot:XP_004360907.1 glycoside hydrolase family 20 protein [Cavenderia fasciculata]
MFDCRLAKDVIYPLPTSVESSSNVLECLYIPYNIDFEFVGPWTLDKRQLVRSFYHTVVANLPVSTFFPSKSKQSRFIIVLLNGSSNDDNDGHHHSYNKYTIPTKENEQYKLYVDKEQVRMMVYSHLGAMNAIKTLVQVVYANKEHAICVIYLPLVIKDSPSIEYRGLLLDTEFIKSLIRGMNISNEQTYTVIGQILSTLGRLFPDPYIHLGGDEVSVECWLEDKELVARMAQKGIHSGDQYMPYFLDRLLDIANKTLPPSKQLIFWEDSFVDLFLLQHGQYQKILHPNSTSTSTSPVYNSNNIIYQVWKGGETIGEYLRDQEIIYSFGFYMDPSFQSCKSFEDCYSRFVPTNISNLLGVEGCAWEMTQPSSNCTEKDLTVVERGFNDRVWFRLIAMSENLWSHDQIPKLTNNNNNNNAKDRAHSFTKQILSKQLSKSMLFDNNSNNPQTTIDRILNHIKKTK